MGQMVEVKPISVAEFNIKVKDHQPISVAEFNIKVKDHQMCSPHRYSVVSFFLLPQVNSI